MGSTNHALCILAVDSEPLLLNLYEEVFTQLGHQVTAVNSGAGALQAVSATAAHFDVVITDLSMPEMNGLTLRDKLRDRAPDIPVYAVSSWANYPEYRERILHQFDGALGKPFHIEELESLISQVKIE